MMTTMAAVTNLSAVLEELHMSQYLHALVEAGFDSWKILCDITEADLCGLPFNFFLK